MATQQFAINATVSNSIPVPNDADRRSLYIRNYGNSSSTMWVAFGQPATPGTNGEMEIVPGSEYSFGGDLKPSTKTLPGGFYLPNCPHESINVITTTLAIATITVSNDHTAAVTLVNPTSSISMGDTIVIAGNSSSPFNGTWTVAAVSSSTVITFTARSNVTPEGFGGTLGDATVSTATGCVITQ